jgi:hypothetical protein
VRFLPAGHSEDLAFKSAAQIVWAIAVIFYFRSQSGGDLPEIKLVFRRTA